MDVVTLGETMVLMAPSVSGPLRFVPTFHRYAAGAESNVAIGLARLGHRVGWISRLGDDEFGRYILATVRGEGVDVSCVRFDGEAPTGVVFKERRELGRARVYYYRRGSAASRMSPEDLVPEYIAAARYLHVTGITPALSPSCKATVERAIELARQAGVRVSFDPNIRLTLWDASTARRTLLPLVASAHVVLPGLDEAQLLTGEDDPERAAAALLALGPEVAVVKLGADGALAVTARGERARVSGLRLARVVDPVGAGDGFAAGFLAGQLRGMDLAASLDLGAVVGACATTVYGDTEGLPTWEELQQIRAGHDVYR